MSLKLIGTGLSPFVRKARTVLAEKGIDYQHDPMMPFGVSDEYKRKHPLGKVPLLEDGDRIIPDSSAICAYLERVHPHPALYPSDPYEYARAIWLEEYADSALVGACAVRFQENLLARAFFKREPDAEKVRKTDTEVIPPIFDYLERTLGDADYLVGNRFSIADVATASPFANFFYGDGKIDAGRWPALAAYIERVHARPSFKGLIGEDRRGLEASRG